MGEVAQAYTNGFAITAEVWVQQVAISHKYILVVHTACTQLESAWCNLQKPKATF